MRRVGDGGTVSTVTSALLALLLASAALPSVPRFRIEPSPIGIEGDVRPNQYLGVVGRRSAWLGSETGEAELWVHPLKLATGFRLGFRVPEYADPIRAADLARTVETRPELTTITYTHATFTVREHILAPLEEPGLLLLLEVDTYRLLEIEVSFRSVFQLAWPGGFGGQYVFWDEQTRAFVLSESLRRTNALIGSPWASHGSEHPAHALPDAPSRFTIQVQPERAAREYVPIAVAAGTTPRPEVLETYRRLLERAEVLYRERRAHAERLLATTTSFSSPDAGLDLALRWAMVNLDEQVVCNPDLGCGLVAGWGASGESARPGFGWFFGGDAAINSLAMSAAGLTAPVAEGLRFLAKHQRDDGKLPHEISQSAARIPWFRDFPYAYYHADTTPFWLVALWRYWRATGDTELVRELWPQVLKAWGWCLANDGDGDALIENTTGGLGAIEVGEIGDDIHQDVYLAAVWTQATRAVAEMAGALGEPQLAEQAEALRSRATQALNERYWIDDAGHHAFGILKSGKAEATLTVWPATAAAFGLLDPPRADRTLAQIAGHELTSDWGARMLTTRSRLYDPTHYNMGAVWPFVTGFVAWGHYQYGRPWAGFPLVEALGRMAFDWSRGRHPELLSGAYYRPLDTAVPHQFFATSMLVSSLVGGMLGWEPDAPRGRARLAPQLPPQWDRLRVGPLRVGASALQVVFEQGPRRLTARVLATGPDLLVELSPWLPPGAGEVRATLDGLALAARVESHPHGERLHIEVPASRVERTAEIAWTGGLAVEPPKTTLRPGQGAHGLRVLDVHRTATDWTIAVEGLAGRSYELRLHGAPPAHVEGAEIVSADPEGVHLLLTFPPSAERVLARTISVR